MDGGGRSRGLPGLRPEEGEGPTGGDGLSAAEERSRRTASGEVPGGPWAGSWPGPDSVPWPFIFSFFLFFQISISFVTFARELQFQSNQKPRFSKIKDNVLRQ
jgi:hypothetical protein